VLNFFFTVYYDLKHNKSLKIKFNVKNDCDDCVTEGVIDISSGEDDEDVVMVRSEEEDDEGELATENDCHNCRTI